MNNKSVLIVGVHRSGTTFLGDKLGEQIGKFISEPWNSWVHIDSYKASTYPIDNYISKSDTVIKTFPDQLPLNYTGSKLNWLLELVEYIGVSRTILISRKNFKEHLTSYTNLMYRVYKHRQFYKDTGIFDSSLKLPVHSEWREKDIPEWFLNLKDEEKKNKKDLTKNRDLLFKLSTTIDKKITWYEDLYGEDRIKSLDVIKSWNLSIDENQLNIDLNPKYKKKKSNLTKLI